MTLVPTFPDAHAVQLPLNSAKHSALPTGWLKTIGIYCLTALVARNIPSRCRQAWFLLMALRENPSPVSLPVSGGHLQSVACSCGPVSYSSHIHTVSWLPRDTGVSPILLHGSLYFRSHPWCVWSAVSSPPQRRLILLGTVAILTCGVSLPCLSVLEPNSHSTSSDIFMKAAQCCRKSKVLTLLLSLTSLGLRFFITKIDIRMPYF